MRLRSMNSRGLATTIRARSFVAADKARSNSLGPPTPNLDPEGSAAASISCTDSRELAVSSHRTATRETIGRSSLSSCLPAWQSALERGHPRDVASRSPEALYKPKPHRVGPGPHDDGNRGSQLLRGAGRFAPAVTITSTGSRTSSAANPGSRSTRPCAQRTTNRMLCPSTYRNCWSACRKAFHQLRRPPSGAPRSSVPIIGTLS